MPSSRPTKPPTALPGLAGRPLHPRLEALLLRVQAAERSAVGAHRRPTFRLMRELLGASIRFGVPARVIADCLGTTRESVRNRASGVEGTITPQLIRELTDLTARQLDRLSGGELTRHGDRESYETSDLIRALINTPHKSPRRR